MVGEGPKLGNWEQTVRYFEDRPRGYALASGSLRRIAAEHPPVPVWPLQAEVDGDGMLPRLLDLAPDTPFPALHSAASQALRKQARPPTPQPAAGRVVSIRWPSGDPPRSGGEGAAGKSRRASC